MRRTGAAKQLDCKGESCCCLGCTVRKCVRFVVFVYVRSSIPCLCLTLLCPSFTCSSAHVVSCCGAAVRRLFIVLVVQIFACFISLSFVHLLFCSCGVVLRRCCALLIHCPYCSSLCLLHLTVLRSLALLLMLCCAASLSRCAQCASQ